MTGTVDQQHFDDDSQVIFEETSKNEGVYVLDSGQQLQNTNDILLHFYSDLLTDAAIGQSWVVLLHLSHQVPDHIAYLLLRLVAAGHRQQPVQHNFISFSDHSHQLYGLSHSTLPEQLPHNFLQPLRQFSSFADNFCNVLSEILLFVGDSFGTVLLQHSFGHRKKRQGPGVAQESLCCIHLGDSC